MSYENPMIHRFHKIGVALGYPVSSGYSFFTRTSNSPNIPSTVDELKPSLRCHATIPYLRFDL